MAMGAVAGAVQVGAGNAGASAGRAKFFVRFKSRRRTVDGATMTVRLIGDGKTSISREC